MTTILQVIAGHDSVVFINPKTDKAETVRFEERMSDEQAIKHTRTEVKARGAATQACLSLLVSILDNPRLDGYKGATGVHTPIPSEMKGALREMEEAYLKPLFTEGLPKSLNEGQKQKEWDSYIKALREPGIYARVRSSCVKYFAHLGKLPCAYDVTGEGESVRETADKNRLLPVSAMDKILMNEKAKVPMEHKDDSIGAMLGALQARMIEEKPDANGLQIVIGRLEQFLTEAKQLKNQAAIAATDTLTQLGVVVPDSVVMGQPAANALPAEKAPAKRVKKDEPALI